MNILKAILLTLLLIAIFACFQIVTLLPFKNLYANRPILTEHLFGLSTILGFLISYFLIFRFFWKPEIKELKIIPKKINTKILIYLILIGLGLRLIDNALFDLEKIYDFYLKNNFFADYPGYYKINTSIIYHAISAILIAPVFEELFFRKYILSKLLLKNNKIIALTISSLCFSLIHIETPTNLLPTFIFGVISGLIFIKTNKIFYCIIFHLIMNSLWLILLVFGEKYYQWIYQLNFNYIYWLFPLFGILLVSMGINRILKTET